MSDFRPCRDCKDWNTCLLTESEKDWFGYKDITYCPQHVFWILKYGDIIRGHRWPAPADTALGGVTTIAMSSAAFESVSTVLAEVNHRLDRIKPNLKGELLREQCKNRDRLQYLSDEAKDALYYVAGERKHIAFVVWLAKRRYGKHYSSRERYKKYTMPGK